MDRIQGGLGSLSGPLSHSRSTCYGSSQRGSTARGCMMLPSSWVSSPALVFALRLAVGKSCGVRFLLWSGRCVSSGGARELSAWPRFLARFAAEKFACWCPQRTGYPARDPSDRRTWQVGRCASRQVDDPLTSNVISAAAAGGDPGGVSDAALGFWRAIEGRTAACARMAVRR